MLVDVEGKNPTTQNTANLIPCLDSVYVELALDDFETIDEIAQGALLGD